MKERFNIGERLQKIRTALNLSQEQMALRTGITTTYYGQIERNLKNPTIHVIEDICSAFNMSLEDFFHEETLASDHDIITQNIVLQLQACTEAEKKTIYTIIQQIRLLQNHDANK